MDYSKMTKEQLVQELEKKRCKANVYISHRNSNVICVRTSNRAMFPVSASKEAWKEILEVVDEIKALL